MFISNFKWLTHVCILLWNPGSQVQYSQYNAYEPLESNGNKKTSVLSHWQLINMGNRATATCPVLLWHPGFQKPQQAMAGVPLHPRTARPRRKLPLHQLSLFFTYMYVLSILHCRGRQEQQEFLHLRKFSMALATATNTLFLCKQFWTETLHSAHVQF